ncbi:2-polyprenyl-6-methoxyphenol hydroxylase-like FAD-dependent oxidoreductase [Pseudonocardia hierapolitana]|uniref:2-polyprenyl-6-methoxyphenol hydroxylase-like FAD-dependent oxidoreductase n=1 Tax=Pseudonocardia hierapolitana TaxID=1128676 RepID=A0A561STV5_9PSEU|nr:FAD-dependent monooxygenase [Pseudonocardia hierapolitana]TWF78308.1 2-polyprenyl-6-methoxyphenol hydroxylase-like FAD-dependent oxidoreductase [Pseudonocardia hierapolitana]
MHVLISGASVAGPTLAYWLLRRGYDVTVVEQAPRLRTGGHGVDFRGAQMELLRRMDLVDSVRAAETGMGEQVVVDESGRALVTLPAAFMSGEVEIQRGDLARILYERTREDAEYVFGDSITALAQDASGVDATFERGGTRRFDFVVGADGTHSGVRSLVWGPEERFSTFLGFYQAGFSVPNHWGLDHSGLLHNEPGLGVMISSGRDAATAGVGLVFSAPPLEYDRRDRDQIVGIVTDRFADAGWEVPRLLTGLASATDLWFDRFAQIHLSRWSQGRIVLLGDAAWAAGPGGSGTGLAMAGAYILAAELAAAGGDHTTAFARYEAALRKGAVSGQKQARNAGPFLAPPTTAKIRRRNRVYRVLSSRLLLPLFVRLTEGSANTVRLDRYPADGTLVR